MTHHVRGEVVLETVSQYLAHPIPAATQHHAGEVSEEGDGARPGHLHILLLKWSGVNKGFYVNKDVEKGREALLKLFNLNSYLRKSLVKRSTFQPSPTPKV